MNVRQRLLGVGVVAMSLLAAGCIALRRQGQAARPTWARTLPSSAPWANTCG